MQTHGGLATSLVAGTMLGVCAAAHAAPGGAVAPPKGAPEYEAPPRPTDGAFMALTVAKLKHGIEPQRPLLIWAIGSSFTNALGNGQALIGMIRASYPDAPEIIYRKMAGCSTSYHFLQGWARHLVIPDQPDVVLIYNYGKTEDLEKVIVDLRKHTTADIIVPTLHWCKPHAKVWPDPDARNSHQDPVPLREMCRKHGVEFVESRRELTEYMLANGLVPEDLLSDSVHQNPYAAKMINMNIARHFHEPAKRAYAPASRERRLAAGSSEVVATPKARWAVEQQDEDSVLRAVEKGSVLDVRFSGTRIDLIGFGSPDAGSVDVWIDNLPAEQADVFACSYVKPDAKNVPHPPMPPRDRCPHAVTLGSGLVPQDWALTMTSDQGDFELVGSVTGSDGKGNAHKPFTSVSGQITIEPSLWRVPDTNRTADRFTFSVSRCAVSRVELGKRSGKFRLTLVRNLPNRPHTLRLVTRDDGPVCVTAFDVFEPPLK